MNQVVANLLKKHAPISNQVDTAELHIILNSLSIIIDKKTPGSIVEMGCYIGTTSLYISRLLKLNDSKREFHVYDSFTGLPDKSAADSSVIGEQFVGGELAASKKQFIQNFKKAGLPSPIIHKAWFENLSADDLPEQIAFAFLDGDFYSSISASLKLITPRLAARAIIVVDDYQNDALPGARKAVNEWMNSNYSLRSEASLAIITT